MPSRGEGITMVIVGSILLFLGIISWFIYIPVFSWFFIGEIAGTILIIVGARAIYRANKGYYY